MAVADFEILPTITTAFSADWRSMITEADELGLKRLCLFLTGLERHERDECYQILANSQIKEIPFVHLRTDMDVIELDFLSSRYGAKIFNVHVWADFQDFSQRCAGYMNQVYIENTHHMSEKDYMAAEAGPGWCLDISHWEDAKVCAYETYAGFAESLSRVSCACGHISAVLKEPRPDCDNEHLLEVSSHHASDFSEFNYVSSYQQYLSGVFALELDNPLSFQLKIIDHIYSQLGIKS